MAGLQHAQLGIAWDARKVANSQPDVQQEVKERKRANPEAVESALSDAARNNWLSNKRKILIRENYWSEKTIMEES